MNPKSIKILVAAFSHSGNTLTIAEAIHTATASDLFEIKPVKPYPKDYTACTDQAKREQNENAGPQLATRVESMDSYDVIFIGYPNWWSTMPMPVFTFLEGYDFSGKTIIPFCTHEGSGLGHSERDIARPCPQAALLKGLAIRGSSVISEQNIVAAWLTDIGMND